jgi:hypothetical protein
MTINTLPSKKVLKHWLPVDVIVTKMSDVDCNVHCVKNAK